MMARYLIDTNVLLRSVDISSAQHSLAINAISSLKVSNQDLLIAPQVLMEFWSVATRPSDVNGLGWSVGLVRREVAKFLDLFSLLPETPAVFEEWLRLVAGREIIGKQVHDARLVALLKTHQVTHLLTFNIGDFKNYDIAAVSPDEILTS
jgi:predicted nucleic acid-binding protein